MDQILNKMFLKDLKINDKIILDENNLILRTKDGFVGQNPNIALNFNPEAKDPIVVKKLFSLPLHDKIRSYLKLNVQNLQYDNKFNRNYSHDNPYFVHLHKQLSEPASKIFGEEVKPSYVFYSEYGDKGVCPFHTDRPQCKYTIDYCIDQDEIWPIYVDNNEVLLQPNDAVCYSGTDSLHYRKKITGKYCVMVFFHFVPINFEGPLS